MVLTYGIISRALLRIQLCKSGSSIPDCYDLLDQLSSSSEGDANNAIMVVDRPKSMAVPDLVSPLNVYRKQIPYS